MNKNLEKYEIYLQIITSKLKAFFREQSPYIYCKEGCSLCCKTGQYPFSKIEFEYLMQGFENLDEETKSLVEKNIQELVNIPHDENFMYKCPFLIDHKCSVYAHRGLICRSYGLAFFDNNNEIKLPHCVGNGLNYSSVYNPHTKKISQDLFDLTGFSQEPLAHNVKLSTLLDNKTTRLLEIDFGEEKSLIDWL